MVVILPLRPRLCSWQKLFGGTGGRSEMWYMYLWVRETKLWCLNESGEHATRGPEEFAWLQSFAID